MPLLTPQYDFHRIEEIPTDFFIRHGIRALLLDVDNTLTGDNSQEIKPEVMDWLERQRACSGVFMDWDFRRSYCPTIRSRG